ncbi:MAG: hypothetical protein IKT67_00845 [Lachnospiraceae bacterium]|nr:hypothetical protein [Lachnospiraceae bacterium]
MYYNKKRMKAVALMGVILLLGVCGCTAEALDPEEQKQENMVETVTKAVEQDEAEPTQAVTQQPAEITQAVTEKEEEIAGEVKPTESVETQPADSGEEAPVDEDESELPDAENTENVEDTEEPEATDVLKEPEPEELVRHVLTNAEGVPFTSGGEGETELLGYAEEKDVAYFIMKKKNSFGRTQEEVYIGILNPETGELLQHQGYGNTTADAVMIEKETGLYIVYATECTDFGLYSGRGGVLLAKDGTLTPVWPVTPEGVYDDGYWSGHTAKLSGETLEIYKVIVTEVSPDGIASEMKTELEQTLTLDEILAGAV